MGYDFAEKDLAHIRNVLDHLEHSTGGVGAVDAGSVISLAYWRARIRTILAMPLPPMHVERQAKDLLDRLDRLEDLRRCTGTGGDVRSVFSAY